MPAVDYTMLADIYDRFVKTDLDVAFFREEVRQVKGGVLELMCGTGRLTLPLLADCASLTCVDSSPDMLAHLRAKLKSVTYSPEIVEQDVTRLSLPGQFDLVLIPFNAFSEITSPADERDALRSIRDHLSPQGKLVVTLHNPAVRLRKVDGCPHEMGSMPADERGELLSLTLTEEYDASTGMVTGQEVFAARDSGGRLLWQRTIALAFRLLSVADLEAMATQAGLSVDRVYGNYDRSPYDPSESPFIICFLRRENLPG
jgi:SAM-dependent methyltransferase